MKYKVLKYINIDAVRQDTFLCEDTEGKRVYIDFFTDASYKGFGNLNGEVDKKRESFVGRYVEIKELFPFIPLMFAKNIKLLPLSTPTK